MVWTLVSSRVRKHKKNKDSNLWHFCSEHWDFFLGLLSYVKSSCAGFRAQAWFLLIGKQPVSRGAIITESVWSPWIFSSGRLTCNTASTTGISPAVASKFAAITNLWQWVVLITSTWEGSKWEQPSRKERKKKVCSSRTSAATSHSAHFHHLPLSISLCWQIKIHGLPSHPFSLLCLIVSKIEEITGRDLCTNKNLSETWQCIPWHTHAHIDFGDWGAVGSTIMGCLRYQPLSFLVLPFLYIMLSNPCLQELEKTLERRKNLHRDHTSSQSGFWCRSSSSLST